MAERPSGSREAAEPDGAFRRLTGHAIAWLYIASAVVVIAYAPTAGSHRRVVVAGHRRPLGFAA